MFATVHVSHAPLVRMPPALALLQQLRADNAVTLPITALERLRASFPARRACDQAGISALAHAAIQPNEHRSQGPSCRSRMIRTTKRRCMNRCRCPSMAKMHQRQRTKRQSPMPRPMQSRTQTPTRPSAQKRPRQHRASRPSSRQRPNRPPSKLAQPSKRAKPKLRSLVATIEPAQPTLETAINVEEKKAKHKRLAAKSHRMRRARASVFATTQSFKQNLTYSATTFETAPQAWPPQAQKQPVRGQRPKTTVEAPVDSGSAMGGPFVSAPSR